MYEWKHKRIIRKQNKQRQKAKGIFKFPRHARHEIESELSNQWQANKEKIRESGSIESCPGSKGNQSQVHDHFLVKDKQLAEK